jgi:hypothetical protein
MQRVAAAAMIMMMMMMEMMMMIITLSPVMPSMSRTSPAKYLQRHEEV